jgi:hypothetical protein
MAGKRKMTKKIRTNRTGEIATRNKDVFMNPADVRICSILPLE